MDPIAANKKKSEELLKKNPDRVPVVIAKNEHCLIDFPNGKKHHKCLSPCKQGLSALVSVLNSELQIPRDTKLLFFVNGTQISLDTPASSVYQDLKHEDGFLYITFCREADIQQNVISIPDQANEKEGQLQREQEKKKQQQYEAEKELQKERQRRQEAEKEAEREMEKRKRKEGELEEEREALKRKIKELEREKDLRNERERDLQTEKKLKNEKDKDLEKANKLRAELEEEKRKIEVQLGVEREKQKENLKSLERERAERERLEAEKKVRAKEDLEREKKAKVETEARQVMVMGKSGKFEKKDEKAPMYTIHLVKSPKCKMAKGGTYSLAVKGEATLLTVMTWLKLQLDLKTADTALYLSVNDSILKLDTCVTEAYTKSKQPNNELTVFYLDIATLGC